MDERRQCPECRFDVEADDSACPFCGVVLKKAAPLGRIQGVGPTARPQGLPRLRRDGERPGRVVPPVRLPAQGQATPDDAAGGTLVSALIGGFAMFVLFSMVKADRRGARRR